METTLTDEQRGTGERADVNGIRLYYEVHGPASATRTLILLHGGLGSGGDFAAILPALSEGRRCILVDLQGHGRTADIDRPIDVQLMAGDIAALIGHLGLERPDVLGYSLGGGVAFFVAARHPELVGKVIVVSAHIRSDAIYPEMRAQQRQLGAPTAEMLDGTPMFNLYQRVAPNPGGFAQLLDKIGASMTTEFDFADVVRSLQVPTLIACGDADMAPPSHYVEVFNLLGGGLRDGGWMGEGRAAGSHALAIIPGATHYDVATSPALAAAAIAFLDAADR
ncbi:MAG TPA: alpha/beta fold hydrolase [Candidatus Limnocylindria bacterium]|nr:alpha/beta fold hydrolase [Candidatus Limnocylindria bacterium]